MHITAPVEIYKSRINELMNTGKLLKSKRKRLGWLRFLAFVLMIAISWKTFVAVGNYGFIVIAVGLGVLLFLISKDSDNNKEIENNKFLQEINQEELNVLDNNYQHLYNGAEFNPPVHEYANDIDLFGNSSLFQFINRGQTDAGKKRLAENLLNSLPVEEIINRQQAIIELSKKLEWRQQLQAYGMKSNVSSRTESLLNAWLDEKDVHFTLPLWKLILPVYSIITLLSLGATVAGYIPLPVFGFLFILYVFISGLLLKKSAKAYADLSKIISEVETVQLLVNWIEQKSFSSALLSKVQSQLKTGQTNASQQMLLLKRILNRFDLLLNPIGNLFLNTFLLWGTRQMMALNEWRKINKDKLHYWFESVAEMEVINSLSSVHFNNPGWVFPVFNSEFFKLKAINIGHPLIPVKKRVDNNFETSGCGKINIVTGSNMAGKSTFLRTLGTNIILAQMGSVVCATQFEMTPVKLVTSMRISDNLAEDTSTFYAELKKLKSIIESVRRHDNIFILLDEILRGTNSMDRHAGSVALLTQLIREKAVAVVATHDIELANLKDNFRQSIENYHFDVQVEGEELYFDYKLKEGICTSMNASILMKKIGIDMIP